MNYLIRFFRLIKNHFGKILSVILFTFLFGLLLFPFSDLSDFISSQVLKLTNNQIYLQFNKLHLNPFTATVELDDVSLEMPEIDHLNIKKLMATPSIMALISKKPGGEITANGIMSGQLSIKLSPVSGDKSENQKSKIEAKLDQISLKELKQSLNLSFPISGVLSLNSTSQVDLSFTEQPDGDLSFQVQKFEMNSTMINLPDLGALNLPEIKFSSIQGKSKFQNGKYTIESLKLGTTTDDFSGTISGDLNMLIQNQNGKMTPVVSGYNLKINLLAKPTFKDRAGFFLNFISQFQKEEAEGTRYKFSLISENPQLPPRMTALQ